MSSIKIVSKQIVPCHFKSLKMSLENAIPCTWKSLIPQWLAEDVPSFDYGGAIVGASTVTAVINGKGKVGINMNVY